MTDLRRLSSVPAPIPGEAFTSWVARSAEFHDLSPADMLEFLGVPVARPRVCYGFELDPWTMVSLKTTSGLRLREMQAMFPRDGRGWRGDLPRSWDWHKAGKRLPWMWRPRGSAVCPECLARRPAAWKLDWRLLTVVACPEHRIYLHGWCPSCRGPIHIGTRPDHLRVCPGPPAHFLARKLHRRGTDRKRRCGALLEELPRYPVENDQILELQHRLTERLIGTDAEPVPPEYGRDLHMALRFAVQLGTLEMLASTVDPPVWLAFSLFEPVRDRVARTVGDEAAYQYSSLYSYRPGPMLMAAAISIVAALTDAVNDPIQAAIRIAEHYTDRVSEPEFLLLERALVGNDVFGAAAGEQIQALRDLELGPVAGWRDRLVFVADDGLIARFGPVEELVGLGEWAMALTSPVMAEPPSDPAGSTVSASAHRR